MLVNHLVAVGLCCALSFVAESGDQDQGARWRISNYDAKLHLDYVPEGSDAYGSFRFTCIQFSGRIDVSVQLDDENTKATFSDLAKQANPYEIFFNKDNDHSYLSNISYDESFGWKANFQIAVDSSGVREFEKPEM